MNNQQRFSGDWEKTSMGHIGSIYGGLSGKGKSDFEGGNARYVTFLGVLENVILNVSHTEQVHVRHGESQNLVRKDDLLFNASSETPGDLAIGAVVGQQLDNLYLNSFCFGFRIHDKDKYIPLFLAYFFRGNVGRDIMNALAQGATRYNLSKSQFRDLELSMPPIEEQRAIAEALSDVDGLINALDALIAKKRAIKQATMQQLLTGKTRLPGFSGTWETKRLGSIFSIWAASSKSQYITKGGRYIIVDMGSVATDGQLIASKFTNYEGDFLKEGDLVMPKDDIGGGKIIGKVAYVDANNLYVLGDHVYALRLIKGFPKFFSYLINRYETNSSLKSKVGGSAQLGLSRKAVEDQEVPIPSYSEQRAIATVLSDMDAEIAALEHRRDKTIDIKQGMMQQLLTGKVRLLK